MKNSLLLIVFFFGASACATQAQESSVSYSAAHITSRAIRPPSDTFLLMRRDDTLCAIKFTEMWRSKDVSKGTAFHSGDESFRSKYQWYLAAKTSIGYSLHPPSATGAAELRQGALVGTGRLAFSTAKSHIKCGQVDVFWTAPAYVYFSSGRPSLFQDQGVEMALTRWTKLEEVNPNDPKLIWLRYDESRVDSWVPGLDQRSSTAY